MYQVYTMRAPMSPSEFEPLKTLLLNYEADIKLKDTKGWYHLKAQNPSGVGMPHAYWMIDQLLENYIDWSATKVHRWIGYLQCLLVVSNIRLIDDLRKDMREL